MFQSKPDGFQTENYYTHKNGKEVFVEIYLSPFKDKTNQDEYAIVHILDISRQRSIDKKLQISEKRLQEAQYISHLGFWEWDLNKDEPYLSEGLYRIYGLEPQGSLLHFREITEKMLHPDDRKLFQHDIQEAIDNNSSFSFDYRIVLPDGEIRYLLGQGDVTLSENNKATRMAGTVLDITERKVAEQVMYRSHRALKVLNECNHTIVHASSVQELINDICQLIVNTGGYRFAWVGFAHSDKNKTVYPVANAGYEAGYLENSFSWKEDVNKFDPVSDAVLTGRPFLVKNLTTDPTYESIRNSALERAYRSEIALPLLVGEQVIGAIMIYASEADAFDTEEENLLMRLSENLAYGIHSINTRTRNDFTEQSLRDSENKYRLLYEENPAMFFTIDEKGKILSVNKYGAEALGYEVEELSGTSIFDLFKQDHIDIAKSKYQSCLDNPKQVHHWDQQAFSLPLHLPHILQWSSCLMLYRYHALNVR